MPIFLNNRDLLERFRRGNREALEEVYRFYVGSVHGIVRHGFCGLGMPNRLRGGADAGDLVQDIFVRAFAPPSRLGYDGLRPFGPYLHSIARNALVDWGRRSGREVPTDGNVLELVVEERVGDEPPYADPVTMAIVEQFLRDLPADLKAVHEQRYTRGLSQHEAAAALGMTRQRLRTAEARLRDALARTLARGRRPATAGAMKKDQPGMAARP
jgi:RNA polymerase sigma-70 factor (ECF subfamily)